MTTADANAGDVGVEKLIFSCIFVSEVTDGVLNLIWQDSQD